MADPIAPAACLKKTGPLLVPKWKHGPRGKPGDGLPAGPAMAVEVIAGCKTKFFEGAILFDLFTFCN
jgi:hypothetical protein